MHGKGVVPSVSGSSVLTCRMQVMFNQEVLPGCKTSSSLYSILKSLCERGQAPRHVPPAIKLGLSELCVLPHGANSLSI